MLNLEQPEAGRIHLAGRFDAAQVQKAEAFFHSIQSSCVVDFEGLDYISSAGLGVLLGTQKRLMQTGEALKLVNLNPHVKNVFLYAGFDRVFVIE